MKVRLNVHEFYSSVGKEMEVGCKFRGEIEVIGEDGGVVGKGVIDLQGKVGYTGHPSHYSREIDIT